MTEKTPMLWVVVGAIIIAVVAFGTIFVLFNLPVIEPGITFDYTEQRENEIFKGASNYFEGTPVVFKFSSLDPVSIYSLYRIDWSSHDAETFSELVIRFTNRTEMTIVLAIGEDGFLLFRDNVNVIIIHCIPTPAKGMI